MNKRTVLFSSLLLIALLLTAAANFWSKFVSNNDLPIVGITQITTHPALDEAREGIIAGLKDRGYVDKETAILSFKNANGDPSLTLPIAQQFVRQQVHVIVPITTPSALGAAKSTQDIPIVFCGVSDPVGVNLVQDTNQPGGNITGASDQWPFEQQISTFLEIMPDRRKIGLMYKSGDDVAKLGLDALLKIKDKLRFELETRPVSNPSDIYPTAVALYKDVDVVYTGIDHLIAENLESLVRAANEAGKPLLGGDSGAVEKGAIMALSINMTDLGVLCGNMVSDVLEGKNPGEMPIKTLTFGDLFVNKKVADKFNLSVDALKKYSPIVH